MPLLHYLAFVEERERVRKLRDAYEPMPYSNDMGLEYRYSNIRRRDDRITRWLLKHYYPKFRRHDVWFAAAVARHINWPATIELVIPAVSPWNPRRVGRLLESRRGEKIFGGTYTIYIAKGEKSKTKFVPKLLTKVHRLRPLVRKAMRHNSLQETSNVFQMVPGISTFMAGQIVADLSYIPHQLDRAKDLCTWAPIGPGSQKGLNWIYGEKEGHTWKNEDFLFALRELHACIPPKHKMTLHDVQSTLCDFDKYMKVRFTEKLPQRYVPNPEKLP